MARIKLLVSYEGTDFCGWQRQKEHKHASDLPSIQGTLESALSKVFSEQISLSGSGRTDSGVHAVAQIAHFDTDRPLPKDICWAVRGHLPMTITVKAAWEVPQEFHATLSATHKTYRYWIWNQNRSSALLNRFSWWIRKPLDLDFLAEASSFLDKKQDFKSFQSAGTVVQSTVREIYKTQWIAKKNGIVEFRITGSGFLKQMVRNIVGTQVQLYLKGQRADNMAKILQACDRQAAGSTAPPQGLFLEKVYYPQELDNRCRRI